MLQVYGGVYPCNMWRKRIGVSESDECDLCTSKDTFSHQMCNCKKVQDAITAAHDTVWKVLYERITGGLNTEWRTWYDSLLRQVPLLEIVKPVGEACKYKPDGILQNTKLKKLYLLEFTRTTDMWSDSLEVARVRKHDKKGYNDMTLALKKSLQGWHVELLTFVLGDRGMFDERTWETHWETLDLPTKQFRSFAEVAVQMAFEVTEDILVVRRALQKEKAADARGRK